MLTRGEGKGKGGKKRDFSDSCIITVSSEVTFPHVN